jgi:hypothetical protein
MLLTPGGLPPVVFFHLGLRGVDCPSPPGPAGAWPASGARSTATQAWPLNPSPSQNNVFHTFMWIWWAHCSTEIVLIIFLPSLIAHPNGWKLFSLRYPQWHVQSCIGKQLHTILSRTGQSKDCTCRCGNMVRRVTLCTPRTLRTAREDNGLSPALAVFGAPIVLPNELLQN